MSKQLIYAAFNAGKELLSIGLASAPLKSDYLTLYRLQRKFHGIPDIIILEEFEGADWKPIKELWKMRLKWVFNPEWDFTQPDSVNHARKAKLIEQFFKDHTLVSGSEFLREKDKRGPIFTPLHPPATP